MGLKNARLARAEKLDKSLIDKYKLPSEGLVIIESINDDLHANIVATTSISDYLQTQWGEFKEVEIDLD